MRPILPVVIFGLLCQGSPAWSQDVITTVAGGNRNFFSVFTSGGQATDAPLRRLYATAVDSSGNVLAVDSGNCLVVKISPAGILTVLAGDGNCGASEDGPAGSLSLNAPLGLAVDGAGNIFIADTNSHRVRKLSPDGITTTVAGTGTAGFSGDGGPATKASLNSPVGLAMDTAGNLFISDNENHRIRKVTPAGEILTVAGNGRPAFSGDSGSATNAALQFPSRVAVDAVGNLYIADNFNHRIRKLSPAGIITTVAGNGAEGSSGDGGPATSASLAYPRGLVVDAAGNLFISDTGSHRVRKVGADGIIRAVAGNGTAGSAGDGGPATSASLTFPRDLAVDPAGNLYIADTENYLVRKVRSDGIITTVAGNGVFKATGDGMPATSALLLEPSGVALDPAGNLYIADTFHHRIRKVSRGGIITTVAGNGIPAFVGDGGPATSASLNSPGDLALDRDGNLYVSDTNNNRIRKISPAGIITTVAGTGTPGSSGDGGPAASASLGFPGGLAVDVDGNLYIADLGNKRVRKINAAGIITTVAGNGMTASFGDGGPATSASFFHGPYGLAVDAAGNLYIADGGIRKVTPGGVINTLASGGDYIFATGLALDVAGNLYVADCKPLASHFYADARILRVSPTGTITTLAGEGRRGFSGDGGPATSASLNCPISVALDTFGAVYVADTDNNRIRKISTGFMSEPAADLTLQHGFYIVEVRSGPATQEGFWGLEVLVPGGVFPGALYLGGAIQDKGVTPGFGAFYLPEAQNVRVRVEAQFPGNDPEQFSMVVRLLNSARQPVGSDQLGVRSVAFERVLSEGFYILEVWAGARSPRATFQIAVEADSFAGGLDVGGFIAHGFVGFGAFWLPQAAEVKIRVLGQPSYGSAGAASLQLRLLDLTRNALRTVP